MGQRVKTLADEVEAVNLPLIVEFLELYDVFTKGKISFCEAGDRNRSLVDYPDSKNKLAEVFVICVGENAVEDTGTKAVDVEE